MAKQLRTPADLRRMLEQAEASAEEEAGLPALPKPRRLPTPKPQPPQPEIHYDSEGYSYEVYPDFTDERAPKPKRINRKPKNRFVERSSRNSKAVIEALTEGDLSDHLLHVSEPIFDKHSSGPFWFGFDQLDHFEDISKVTRVLAYLSTGAFDEPLVEGVFLPVVEEIMKAAYPADDEFLLSYLTTMCKQVVWDFCRPASQHDYLQKLGEVGQLFPGKEASVRGFISAAKETANVLRRRLAYSYMLLQLLEMSKLRAVWLPPDELLRMDYRNYMPVLGGCPVDTSFSLFVRQLFFSRQMALQAGRKTDRRYEIASVDFGPQAMELNSIVRNRDSILIMFRYHFNAHSYFNSALRALTAKIGTDFVSSASGNLQSGDLNAWIYYTLDLSPVELAPCIREIDSLLLSHLVNAMAARWKFCCRSRTSVPLKLLTRVPEVESRIKEAEIRRIRRIEALDRVLVHTEELPVSARPISLLRDLSPVRRPKSDSEEEKGEPLPPYQFSESELSRLSKLPIRLLEKRTLGRLRDEKAPARKRAAVKPAEEPVISSSGSMSPVQLPRKRGRPKGSKNRPKPTGDI